MFYAPYNLFQYSLLFEILITSNCLHYSVYEPYACIVLYILKWWPVTRGPRCIDGQCQERRASSEPPTGSLIFTSLQFSLLQRSLRILALLKLTSIGGKRVYCKAKFQIEFRNVDWEICRVAGFSQTSIGPQIMHEFLKLNDPRRALVLTRPLPNTTTVTTARKTVTLL